LGKINKLNIYAGLHVRKGVLMKANKLIGQQRTHPNPSQEESLSIPPLAKVHRGRFFHDSLLIKLDFTRLRPQNSPLKKGDKGGCFKLAYLLALRNSFSKNRPLKTLAKGGKGGFD
jgi:hypothetical protein